MMVRFSNEEKKSAVITAGISALLLLLLFVIKFIDSATINSLTSGGGGGVEINFGDSEVGMGPDFQSEVLHIAEAGKKSEAHRETYQEEILSQENTTEKSDYTVLKKTNEKTKTKQPLTAVKESVKKTVSNEASNTLSSFLKSTTKGGDGDDNKAGNKGRREGSLASGNYYGGGEGSGKGTGIGDGTGDGVGPGSGAGTGGGNGYSLSGRKALVKPVPQNKCNESGTVVVQVTVDRNGNVINAVPGVRGTTNNAICLLNNAKKAALNTKWEAKSTALEKQMGSIVYNFRLQ